MQSLVFNSAWADPKFSGEVSDFTDDFGAIRVVFDLPNGYFVVVKQFQGSPVHTVKVWKADLMITASHWKTTPSKVEVDPSFVELARERILAATAILAKSLS
jgi:hypothetical protein